MKQEKIENFYSIFINTEHADGFRPTITFPDEKTFDQFVEKLKKEAPNKKLVKNFYQVGIKWKGGKVTTETFADLKKRYFPTVKTKKK